MIIKFKLVTKVKYKIKFNPIQDGFLLPKEPHPLPLFSL